jgi:hypothetical protein
MKTFSISTIKIHYLLIQTFSLVTQAHQGYRKTFRG